MQTPSGRTPECGRIPHLQCERGRTTGVVDGRRRSDDGVGVVESRSFAFDCRHGMHPPGRTAFVTGAGEHRSLRRVLAGREHHHAGSAELASCLFDRLQQRCADGLPFARRSNEEVIYQPGRLGIGTKRWRKDRMRSHSDPSQALCAMRSEGRIPFVRKTPRQPGLVAVQSILRGPPEDRGIRSYSSRFASASRAAS